MRQENFIQDVEELCVEVEELKDMMWGTHFRSIAFKNGNVPHCFDCSNPLCHGGGMQIGGIISNMIQQRKENEEVRQKCKGREGSPKGRRMYQGCMYGFTIRIRIKYAD